MRVSGKAAVWLIALLGRLNMYDLWSKLRARHRAWDFHCLCFRAGQASQLSPRGIYLPGDILSRTTHWSLSSSLCCLSGSIKTAISIVLPHAPSMCSVPGWTQIPGALVACLWNRQGPCSTAQWVSCQSMALVVSAFLQHKPTQTPWALIRQNALLGVKLQVQNVDSIGWTRNDPRE